MVTIKEEYDHQQIKHRSNWIIYLLSFLYFLQFLYHSCGCPNFNIWTAKELTANGMLHGCELDVNLWAHKKHIPFCVYYVFVCLMMVHKKGRNMSRL